MASPLTAPLAQVALSHTRPSPPSSRPMRIVPPSAKEPDRQHVDKPSQGAAEMAGKKKQRVYLDASQKSILVGKVKSALKAEPGTPKMSIIERVAKEAGLSVATLKKAFVQGEAQGSSGGPPKLSIEITGLEAYVAWHVKNALRKGFGE